MKAFRDFVVAVVLVLFFMAAIAMFKVIGAIAGTVVSFVLAVLAVFLCVHQTNKEDPEVK